jgi:predicted nucleic acid-binding protein
LSVVLDANALIVLALDRQRAVAIEEMLRVWKTGGEDLHPPLLLRYEIASALAQAVSAGQLASEAVADASQRIGSVPIVLHQLNGSRAK